MAAGIRTELRRGVQPSGTYRLKSSNPSSVRQPMHGVLFFCLRNFNRVVRASGFACSALDAIVWTCDHCFSVNDVDHVCWADVNTRGSALALCRINNRWHVYTSFFCFNKVLKYPAIRLRRDLLSSSRSSSNTWQFCLKSIENLSGYCSSSWRAARFMYNDFTFPKFSPARLALFRD